MPLVWIFHKGAVTWIQTNITLAHNTPVMRVGVCLGYLMMIYIVSVDQRCQGHDQLAVWARTIWASPFETTFINSRLWSGIRYRFFFLFNCRRKCQPLEQSISLNKAGSVLEVLIHDQLKEWWMCERATLFVCRGLYEKWSAILFIAVDIIKLVLILPVPSR